MDRRHPIDNEEIYQRELKGKLEGVNDFGERQKSMAEIYNRYTLPLMKQTRFEIFSILGVELLRLLRLHD